MFMQKQRLKRYMTGSEWTLVVGLFVVGFIMAFLRIEMELFMRIVIMIGIGLALGMLGIVVNHFAYKLHLKKFEKFKESAKPHDIHKIEIVSTRLNGVLFGKAIKFECSYKDEKGEYATMKSRAHTIKHGESLGELSGVVWIDEGTKRREIEVFSATR